MRRKQLAVLMITAVVISSITACDKQENKNNAVLALETEKVTANPDTDVSGNAESTATPTVSDDDTQPTVTQPANDESEEPSNTTEPTEVGESGTTDQVTSDESEEVTSWPVSLEEPPFTYYCSATIQAEEAKPIRLRDQSKKNSHVDEDMDWFQNNQLSTNRYYVTWNGFEVADEELPDQIAWEVDGLILTMAFHDDNYIYCTYGANYAEGYILNIYDLETQDQLDSLDFSNYRYVTEYVEEDYDYIQQYINWAAVKDGILYVSNTHSTYAYSSKGMNAYITAIDLSNHEILWRTDPLVSNAGNFLILDDVILSGYGFTAEDDYLYQINRKNGEVMDQMKLPTAPYYLMRKENTLYVRTYNSDLTYEIESE